MVNLKVVKIHPIELNGSHVQCAEPSFKQKLIMESHLEAVPEQMT